MSFDICPIQTAMPKPCMGSFWSDFRMSRSRVPCRRSALLWVMVACLGFLGESRLSPRLSRRDELNHKGTETQSEIRPVLILCDFVPLWLMPRCDFRRLSLRACRLFRPLFSVIRPPMSAESTPLLSPAQRKLVGFALGFAAFCAIGWLLYVVLAGVASFIGAFSGVIWPLAVAGIMALVLRPVVAFFERRLRLSRPIAVVLLYGVFVLLVAGLLVTFLPALFGQLLEFIAYLPTL